MSASAASRLLRLRPTSALFRSSTTTQLSSSSSSSERCLYLPPFLRAPCFQTLLFSSASDIKSTDDNLSAIADAFSSRKDKELPLTGGGIHSHESVEMKKGDWICPKCNFMNFARNIRCLQCRSNAPSRDGSRIEEIRSGDWHCPQCNMLNFARNVRCIRCKTDRPCDVMVKEGDWICRKCNFLNFARNKRCLECHEEKSVTFDNLKVKQGDWNCPNCQFMNYARNTNCLRCNELHPKKQLRPGDWECTSCNFLNFGRNTSCKKCNLDRPEGESSQIKDGSGKSLKSVVSESSDDLLTPIIGDNRYEDTALANN